MSTGTIATSHFLRLFPGSISIGTTAYVRAFVRDRILVRLFSLSLFHFHFFAPVSPPLCVSVRSSCTLIPSSFLLFHFGRPQSPMGEDYTPYPPFASSKATESAILLEESFSAALFAMLPRQFAYLGRLNLKTARNAREPVRLDRS